MTLNLGDPTKKLLIAITAGALGNLLSFLSILLTPMHPQVTFDFSHLATFITAIALGPVYGLIAGAIGSLYPYVHYAVFGIYGPFFGLAIILGKAMTGFICGLLRDKMPIYLAVNISFIPESLYTFGFLQLTRVFLPIGSLNWGIVSGIITEGWVEVIIFSFIIETAVLMLEIFIIMFLVHKEFINTLLILLLITLILFEIIKPLIRKKNPDSYDEKDDY